MTEKRRYELYPEIIEKALDYCIIEITPKEIDNSNILAMRMEGMKRAIEGLKKVDYALIDGNRLPEGLTIPADYLIKGDAKSLSISAASILAKTTIDKQMQEHDKSYPEYGFAKIKDMVQKYIFRRLKNTVQPPFIDFHISLLRKILDNLKGNIMKFFKFFLKGKFGLLEKFDVILILFILPSICISFGMALFKEEQSVKIVEGYVFSWINVFKTFIQFPIFLILFLILYGIISYFLDILRERIPYKKEKIIEDEKEYEVHYYPAFNLKKYYYNGKPHREKEAAHVAISEDYYFLDKKFYLFGHEVKEENFRKMLLIKKKMDLF